MIADVSPVVVQKLNAFAAARAFGAGVRHGRTFERAYSAGRYHSAYRAARHARAAARAHPAGQLGAHAGSGAEAVGIRSHSGFRESFASSRGVSNRLIVRTALSRNLRVPLSMRAGFLAGAARNVVRVRNPRVRGGSYLRRTPA